MKNLYDDMPMQLSLVRVQDYQHLQALLTVESVLKNTSMTLPKDLE